MRFHVLSVPHTATNKLYCGCAFTQKVLTLCKMLKMRGHVVYHYGNELSDVECDENVVVTKATDIKSPKEFLAFDLNSEVYVKYDQAAISAINERKQPNDFLLCTFGAGHKLIGQVFKDMIVVESGIGYPGGWFAPYRVFESYAILHAAYGVQAIERSGHFRWYDVVIPNAFDDRDFIFNSEKDNYLVFLGYRHGGESKGFHVARDAAKDADCRLIVAGPHSERGKVEDGVIHAGLVNVAERAKLLSKARALIAPSIFLEPFAGVQCEAFFSGTPVISTDWGAFAEYNLHGITGFRCRTHEQFVWAIRQADTIDPEACLAHAHANFSLARVAKLYDQYFSDLKAIYGGKGWYEPKPSRQSLDHGLLYGKEMLSSRRNGLAIP